MTTPEEILSALSALPADQRFWVVEQIIDQYSPPSNDMSEEEFIAELERRSADFENGKAGDISWTELRGQNE